MAIAHGLAQESEISFVLIERGPLPGGLAQSVTWKGNGSHDLTANLSSRILEKTLDPKSSSMI